MQQTDKPTGGPAFPQKEPLNSDGHGMTLRDYFAGKAMASIVPLIQDLSAMTPKQVGYLAQSSYCIADAMLAAREAA